MTENGGSGDDRAERTGEGLLRLKCPFCQAEYPLWFRPEENLDETLSPSEWELWLSRRCDNCGRTPREHLNR